MSNPLLPDLVVTAKDSKTDVLLALEQLLEQTDPKDVPALLDQVRTRLAQRCYTLNANQSPLLNLPPELLVKIGLHLLELRRPERRTKYRARTKSLFTKRLFPLLQTCTQLRTQLRPLRSSPLTWFITTDNLWGGVMHVVREWRQKGFHDGPTTLIISPLSVRYTPSYTAAMAGALECAIYGRLSNPSAVYIKLNKSFGNGRVECLRQYYVSSGRTANMLWDVGRSALFEDPPSRLSEEGGVKIWNQAEAELGG